MSESSLYRPSPAANAASNYFNSLPRDERAKLAPLLEHHRQAGLAEAFYAYRQVSEGVRTRALDIQRRDGVLDNVEKQQAEEGSNAG